MTHTYLQNLAKKHVHFIGIGGCSMSGLALVLHNAGFQITGSDLSESSYTKLLDKVGIEYTIGHDAKNVESADLVVFSAAVKEDNCEYARARELDIPLMERSVLLGEISAMYKTSIAISGCHGKTTITSMLTIILNEADLDATAHIGGMVKQLGGGIKIGNSDIFITEACEYVQSFMTLKPSHVLINNIDDDHLDCYKNFDDIKNTFYKFACKVGANGAVYGCADDSNVLELLGKLQVPTVTYGFNEKADYTAKNIVYDLLGNVSYDLYVKGKKKGRIVLNIPGRHNVQNSLAAISISDDLFNIEMDVMKRALKGYILTGRRFELVGEKNGARIIHDYAHHPTEIKACLDAAKHYPHNKLFVVFQCHLFSRARLLKHKYATAFLSADEVLVPDIYGAREKDDGSIHARDLAAAIGENTPAVYLNSFTQIKEHLLNEIGKDDLVLFLGPGDINKYAKEFVK